MYSQGDAILAFVYKRFEFRPRLNEKARGVEYVSPSHHIDLVKVGITSRERHIRWWYCTISRIQKYDRTERHFGKLSA